MAVLDAAELDEVDLLGFADGAPVALLASLTYPERVRSIVLVQGHARVLSAPDYPIGATAEDVARYADLLQNFHFDDEAARTNISLVAPSIMGDDALVEAHIAYLRRACSPGQFVDRTTFTAETDVRDLLPLIRKPTLVFHGRNSVMIPAALGRYLADHIPGCRYVEIDTADYPPFFEMREPLLAELAHFFTVPAPEPDRADGRWLATVLFTDIVDSTARAAEMGDAAWRRLLEEHDRAVTGLVAEYRGDVVKTTGDGVLATFDGPSRAVSCATALRARLADLGVEVRAGVHTGEIETRDADVAGLGVHVASRIMALAAPGEVLVSSTVRDLAVGSGIEFEDRGTHELKGVPDEWRVLAVVT